MLVYQRVGFGGLVVFLLTFSYKPPEESHLLDAFFSGEATPEDEGQILRVQKPWVMGCGGFPLRHLVIPGWLRPV